MSENVLNTARGLEKSIRESNEFIYLKTQYERVFADEETKRMFDNFRDIQLTLQQKQMAGQPITDEEVQHAQQIATVIQMNEDISQLLQAEQRMSELITEINKIVLKPVEELYTENSR